MLVRVGQVGLGTSATMPALGDNEVCSSTCSSSMPILEELEENACC
jgi:hypothetical protein